MGRNSAFCILPDTVLASANITNNGNVIDQLIAQRSGGFLAILCSPALANRFSHIFITRPC